jgi:hypothetical protein
MWCDTSSVFFPLFHRSWIGVSSCSRSNAQSQRNKKRNNLPNSKLHDQSEKKVSFFAGVGWDWVHLVRRPLFGLLYQPRVIDDECGAVGGMRIGRGKRSTRIKPTPVPLCPPQIPHVLNWAWPWAAAVASRRLTAWAMARSWKES